MWKRRYPEFLRPVRYRLLIDALPGDPRSEQEITEIGGHEKFWPGLRLAMASKTTDSPLVTSMVSERITGMDTLSNWQNPHGVQAATVRRTK